MGMCADISLVPVDRGGAIQDLCSSGDGNQGIRSLISHAGFRYEDIVRQFRIQLRIIRCPHSLADAVRALRLCGRRHRMSKNKFAGTKFDSIFVGAIHESPV